MICTNFHTGSLTHLTTLAAIAVATINTSTIKSSTADYATGCNTAAPQLQRKWYCRIKMIWLQYCQKNLKLPDPLVAVCLCLYHPQLQKPGEFYP